MENHPPKRVQVDNPLEFDSLEFIFFMFCQLILRHE